MQPHNPFKPDEPVMTVSVGLSPSSPSGGIGVEFEVNAEYCGCRLCGAVYQSKLDRTLYYEYTAHGIDPRLVAPNAYQRALDRRSRWRELHEKRTHSSTAVEVFGRTGLAFTPEAANKLTPLGMFGTGNMHEEVVAAMAEAPRAPLNDVETS